MKKIMIIEDDAVIANGLARELSGWNYQPVMVTDFYHILEQFQKEQPQLVLLDIVLPHFNGYHWCQEIRKISTVPILFISSRSENMDIVMAMQFGGDDYIVKPIDLTVTVAKIGALLRRSYEFVSEATSISFASLTLDLAGSHLKYGESKTELTKTERTILEVLFRGQGKYVSREAIMEQCWNGDDFIDDNTLAVNMTRLRKKMSGIGLQNCIVTKKGVGYCLAEPEKL